VTAARSEAVAWCPLSRGEIRKHEGVRAVAAPGQQKLHVGFRQELRHRDLLPICVLGRRGVGARRRWGEPTRRGSPGGLAQPEMWSVRWGGGEDSHRGGEVGEVTPPPADSGGG